MAERRGDASGTAGGVDVEPLRGGMQEEEAGGTGPRAAPADQPPAPYHNPPAQEGGLAPVGGAEPDRGSTPREGTPPDPGQGRRPLEEQLQAERRDHQNEAGNAPREG